MTTKKNTTTKRSGLGRVRVCDDSMKGAGLVRGDVAIVALGKRPKDGGLCVAFTATGHLVARRYRRLPNKWIELRREPQRGKIQVFAPRAVYIFGPVVGVEKGGA
jgi:SOS-response transcriptional repressor LexA